MKLTKLEFSFFCGAAWAELDVEIVAESKEECLKIAFVETSAIRLSCPKDDYKLVEDKRNTCNNLDYELFKLNPEKYITFWWEEFSLPLVTVREK